MKEPIKKKLFKGKIWGGRTGREAAAQLGGNKNRDLQKIFGMDALNLFEYLLYMLFEEEKKFRKASWI